MAFLLPQNAPLYTPQLSRAPLSSGLPSCYPPTRAPSVGLTLSRFNVLYGYQTTRFFSPFDPAKALAHARSVPPQPCGYSCSHVSSSKCN